MSISENSQPDTQQPAATIGTGTSSALAIAALVGGIVAFLAGWIPILGLLLGGGAIVIAALALSRKLNKAFALTGLILGGIAALTSLITTFALVGSIASAGDSGTALAPVVATSSASPAPKVTPKPTAAPKPSAVSTPTATPTPTVAPAPPAPVVTVSQSNAVRKAQSYLSYTSFSRSGLIDQLVYEGFSVEDSTYGTDSVGADWSQQAAAKAQSYLEYSAFSREGLIDQLLYEGFSAAEAEFGVVAVGL
jgi:Host cell surface-exposed lipoprotein